MGDYYQLGDVVVVDEIGQLVGQVVGGFWFLYVLGEVIVDDNVVVVVWQVLVYGVDDCWLLVVLGGIGLCVGVMYEGYVYYVGGLCWCCCQFQKQGQDGIFCCGVVYCFFFFVFGFF